MARNVPEDFFVLALRGRVIFPDTTVSLDVGRIQSLTSIKNRPRFYAFCRSAKGRGNCGYYARRALPYGYGSTP